MLLPFQSHASHAGHFSSLTCLLPRARPLLPPTSHLAPNPQVAVDALRQLAMKFLERDELANYTFQNDFLRPFVVVMRQSAAVEVRELILRCLSQMVLARVTNVKSGWKSMFMVFTTAAADRDPMIVR